MRLRAFGNYSYRIVDPKLFHTEISGTREMYTVADLDGQLRGLMLQHISDAVASSGVAFLDLAANQVEFAKALMEATAPSFEKLGLKLEGVTMQNISLPEELQKILDQKIGMGMVGDDMGKFMQYQTAQAIPKFAEGAGSGGGSVVGDAMGLGAGVALGQVMAQQLSQGLQGPAAPAEGAAAAPVGVKPRRRDGHAREARRPEGQGHPHAGRVRREEGGAAEEAGLAVARCSWRPNLHPQRAYRAACPNCGAPVDFRSAASAFAVCSFCKSTIVREGDALRKIGESAELFDDHSPLQLGAAGNYQGAAFTLVGRLQYRYADGTWNEWHALFDDGAGKSAWLSEDNGRYVIAFDAPLDVAVPRERGDEAGRAVRDRRAGLVGRVGHAGQADRGAGRAAVQAQPRARLRRLRPAQHARRGGHARLQPTRRAALVDRPLGRDQRTGDDRACGRRRRREDAQTRAARCECPNCGAALEVQARDDAVDRLPPVPRGGRCVARRRRRPAALRAGRTAASR